MHHNHHTLITVSILLFFMVVVAIFINDIEGTITGAVIGPEECDCKENIDCDDGIETTEDICLYPESCRASLCVNKEK